MPNTHVFSPSPQLDKDLFELMLLDAANSSIPAYIADRLRSHENTPARVPGHLFI